MANQHNDKNDIKDKFQIYSSVAFMIVVVFLGVPMWWKTTEVYRSVLPDIKIKDLDAYNIKIVVNVFIYSSDFKHSKNLINEMNLNMPFNHFKINFVPLAIEINHTKTPAGLEKVIRKNIVIKPGDFLFIEWKKQKESILLTSQRIAFMSERICPLKLLEVLLVNILKSQDILKVINEDKSDRLHGMPVLNQHNVIISILNPDPLNLNINWNVKEAVQIYLEPFLSFINPTSNFTLKTQYKYQVPFDFSLKQIKDNSTIGRHYCLFENELPHIITLIEKNLGFITSDNPIINLIVYIPPCQVSPIYIYRNNGNLNSYVSNNSIQSFASPKWGGVIIHNPPLTLCTKYGEKAHQINFNVRSKEVMESLLFQLYKFYEINTYVEMEDVKLTQLESLYPYEWQFDSYLRRTTVSHITTTIRTLQSLIQLLEDINYIIINDDVGLSINKAYENVIKAKEFLIKGNLEDAMRYAREGYTSSERAFFDSSLLAQLYFPDEQKYAIYIPLFLPIMVPVITSLVMIVKWYVKKN